MFSPWLSSPLKAPTEFEARSPHPAALEWTVLGPELVSQRFEFGVTASAVIPRSLAFAISEYVAVSEQINSHS
jgi:hypothetical protein